MKFTKLAKMLVKATENVPVVPDKVNNTVLPPTADTAPVKTKAIDRQNTIMDSNGDVQESVSKKLSYVNLSKIKRASFALKDVIYGLSPSRLQKLVTTLQDTVSDDSKVLEEKIRQLVDSFTNTEINVFMQSPKDTKVIAEERHSGISMGDDEGI